jgi:hypothetical protein
MNLLLDGEESRDYLSQALPYLFDNGGFHHQERAKEPVASSIDLYAINLKRKLCLARRTQTRFESLVQAASSLGGVMQLMLVYPCLADLD